MTQNQQTPQTKYGYFYTKKQKNLQKKTQSNIIQLIDQSIKQLDYNSQQIIFQLQISSVFTDYISIQTISIWIDKLIKRKNSQVDLNVFLNLLSLCQIRKITNFLDQDHKFEFLLYYYLCYRNYKRQSIIELALHEFIQNTDHYKNDEVFKKRKFNQENQNQQDEGNTNLMQSCGKQLFDKLQQDIDLNSLINMTSSDHFDKEYFCLNKNNIQAYYNNITNNKEIKLTIQSMISKLTYYSSSIVEYRVHKSDAVSLIMYYLLFDLDEAYNFLLEDYKESGREYEISGKIKENKYFSDTDETEINLSIFFNQLSLEFQQYNIEEKTGVTVESFMFNYGNHILINKHINSINQHQFKDYYPYKLEMQSNMKENQIKAKKDTNSHNNSPRKVSKIKGSTIYNRSFYQ